MGPAVVLLFAVVGSAALAACGRVPEPATREGGSGGAGGVVYPPYDAASGGASGGSGGQGGADPRWIPQAWQTCEGLEIARDPAEVAPRLEWEACTDGTPGCLRLRRTWDSGEELPFGTEDGASENVLQVGADLRVPLNIGFARDLLGVVYARDGAPLFAIRAPATTHRRCVLSYFQWSAAGVCVGVAGLETPPEVAFYDPEQPSSPRSDPRQLPPEAIAYCGERFATTIAGSGAFSVTDVKTNESHSLDADGSPRILGDEVLHFRRGAMKQLMLSGASRLLLDVSPDVLLDVRHDGEYLVWITAGPGDLPVGTVWRGKLQDGRVTGATPLGAVPRASLTRGFHRIGGGYYAVMEGSASTIPDEPTRLHLFRLADGRRWIVPDQPDQYGLETGNPPREPGLRTTVAGIVHLDETELWWLGASQSYTYYTSLFRQRLDTLGAGE